jgi:hypothetical protein
MFDLLTRTQGEEVLEARVDPYFVVGYMWNLIWLGVYEQTEIPTTGSLYYAPTLDLTCGNVLVVETNLTHPRNTDPVPYGGLDGVRERDAVETIPNTFELRLSTHLFKTPAPRFVRFFYYSLH